MSGPPQNQSVATDSTGVFQVKATVDVYLRFMYLDPTGEARFFPPPFEYKVKIRYKSDDSVEEHSGDSSTGIVQFETKRAKEAFTVEFEFDEIQYIVNEPLGAKNKMNSLREREGAEEYASPPRARVADIAQARKIAEKDVLKEPRAKAREEAKAEARSQKKTRREIEDAGDKAAKGYTPTAGEAEQVKQAGDKAERETKEFYESEDAPAWYITEARDDATSQAREDRLAEVRAEAEATARADSKPEAEVTTAGQDAVDGYARTEQDTKKETDAADEAEKQAKADHKKYRNAPWYRVFELPKKITLKNSDWECKSPHYDKASFSIDLKTKKPQNIGTETVPCTFTLDPHWQYVKFEYFDRYYGHKDHDNKPIGAVPLLLEGYEDDPGELDADASARKDKWKTRSNWVIGKDDKLENAIQCLPWIIQRTEDGATDEKKPDDKTTLAFLTTEEDRYIKAVAKDQRIVVKLKDDADDAKPCANRLKYYDLPPVWKSRKYWCRLSDKEEDQDFYEKIVKKVTKAKADKGKPLVFSLDDIVLMSADDAGTTLTAIDIPTTERPGVFYHEFLDPDSDNAAVGTGGRAGKKYSKSGLYQTGPDKPGSKTKATDKGKADKKKELEDAARKKAETDKKKELVDKARDDAEKAALQTEEQQARSAAEQQFAKRNQDKIKQESDKAVAAIATNAEAQARIKAAGDKAVQDIESDDAAKQQVTQAGDQAVADVATDASATQKIDAAGTEAGTKSDTDYDAANGYPYSEIKLRNDARHNYVADYPHWTRLVLVNGNLFDVFDKRTKEVAGEPVGARCGVRWVDATTAPGANRPDRTKRTFFTIQPHYEQRYTARYALFDPANDRGIGRVDMALLRCCGKDSEDEIALHMLYFRFQLIFDVQPDNPLTEDQFATQLVQNVPDRWNGPDGGYNPGPPEMLSCDPKKKSKVKLRWFMQTQRQPNAHMRVNVKDIKRASMTSHKTNGHGTGQLGKAYHTTNGPPPGRFSTAHESGHVSGLPDEYGEGSSDYSYGHRGFRWNLPGDPFVMDDAAMMRGNRELRARHYWHSAEWLWKQFECDFKIKHGVYDEFKLPHHPDAPKKSYAWWPIKHAVTATLADHGKFDLFLYRLGLDATAKSVYPAYVNSAGTDIDGILVVVLNLRVSLWNLPAAALRGLTRVLVSTADTHLNKKWYATGRAEYSKKATDGATSTEQYTFQRCMIQFSPRILGATWANGVKGKRPGGASGNITQAEYPGRVASVANRCGVHQDIKILPAQPPATPVGHTWPGTNSLDMKANLAGNTQTANGNLMTQFDPLLKQMCGITDPDNPLGKVQAIAQKVFDNAHIHTF